MGPDGTTSVVGTFGAGGGRRASGGEWRYTGGMKHVLGGMALFALVGCVGTRSASQAGAEGRLEIVEMRTSKGTIVLELDRERAPVTVANFLKYADRGAYDGTIFHRVVENFVIQGGGYTAELVERAKIDQAAGNPDVAIVNEWRNGLKNERGTIGMAREAQADTATREFYINVQDNPRLDTPRAQTGDAGYAVFGRVVRGMEVVDAIRKVATAPRPTAGVTDGSLNNVPTEAIVILSVKRGGTVGVGSSSSGR